MAEYIKQEDLLSNKVFMKGGAAASPYVQGYLDGLDAVEEAITTPPAADVVEVRHGEWLGTEYDGYADGNPVYDVFACSVCGCEYDTDDGEMHHNYCPNCGAKMDGGVNDG